MGFFIQKQQIGQIKFNFRSTMEHFVLLKYFLHLSQMKYLAIIICLYMTVLTLLPCQDKDDFASPNEQSVALEKPTKDATHIGQEICPPFCTCTCCSVSRDFVQAKAFDIVVYNVQTQYAEYKVPAISEQLIEIYQPPQIV